MNKLREAAKMVLDALNNPPLGYVGDAATQAIDGLTTILALPDATSPEQEALAIQFCCEIAGVKGERGNPPDPVRLLEMAKALYEADRNDKESDK